MRKVRLANVLVYPLHSFHYCLKYYSIFFSLDFLVFLPLLIFIFIRFDNVTLILGKERCCFCFILEEMCTPDAGITESYTSAPVTETRVWYLSLSLSVSHGLRTAPRLALPLHRLFFSQSHRLFDVLSLSFYKVFKLSLYLSLSLSLSLENSSYLIFPFHLSSSRHARRVACSPFSSLCSFLPGLASAIPRCFFCSIRLRVYDLPISLSHSILTIMYKNSRTHRIYLCREILLLLTGVSVLRSWEGELLLRYSLSRNARKKLPHFAFHQLSFIFILFFFMETENTCF